MSGSIYLTLHMQLEFKDRSISIKINIIVQVDGLVNFWGPFQPYSPIILWNGQNLTNLVALGL